MTAKSITPTDEMVGRRIREARLATGMSQEKLAELLGLTFQQVQKYEKGRNRVSVARLLRIAQILDRPPAYFYDGQGEDRAPGPWEQLRVVAADADGHRLATALADMTPSRRRALLTLLEAA